MRSPTQMAPPQRQLALVAADARLLSAGPPLPGRWPTHAARRGPVTRIGLGPGEWALALLPPRVQRREARPLVRDLVSGCDLGARARGGRCAVVRIPAEALAADQLGQAVLHHALGRVTVYCPANQIAEETAQALALIASRAAGILAPAETGYEIGLVRVPHRELPAGVHPAQVETRPAAVTAYVCAETITQGLGDALALLSTACTTQLARPFCGSPGGELRPRLA